MFEKIYVKKPANITDGFLKYTQTHTDTYVSIVLYLAPRKVQNPSISIIIIIVIILITSTLICVHFKGTVHPRLYRL